MKTSILSLVILLVSVLTVSAQNQNQTYCPANYQVYSQQYVLNSPGQVCVVAPTTTTRGYTSTLGSSVGNVQGQYSRSVTVNQPYCAPNVVPNNGQLYYIPQQGRGQNAIPQQRMMQWNGNNRLPSYPGGYRRR